MVKARRSDVLANNVYQLCSWLYGHVMYVVPVRGRHMLLECSAQRNVDDLHTATYRQRWNTSVQCPFSDRQVERVLFNVDVIDVI
jgi:hypothetical protein